MAISRVLSCAPNVLVVEKNVPQFVLEELVKADVTVIHNVAYDDMNALAINMDSEVFNF